MDVESDGASFENCALRRDDFDGQDMRPTPDLVQDLACRLGRSPLRLSVQEITQSITALKRGRKRDGRRQNTTDVEERLPVGWAQDRQPINVPLCGWTHNALPTHDPQSYGLDREGG